jgi:type II secretory pathway component PulK
MRGRREKAGIALLIVVAMLAVVFAMLEALESSSETTARAERAQTSDL